MCIYLHVYIYTPYIHSISSVTCQVDLKGILPGCTKTISSITVYEIQIKFCFFNLYFYTDLTN